MAVMWRHGDVLTQCALLEPHSVHCCVTSPPYYGLRDYEIAPTIWPPVRYAPLPGLPAQSYPETADPEGYASCVHVWEIWSESHTQREETRHGKTRTTDRHYGGDASRRFNGNHQKHSSGQFCRLCGAWRGCLGQEPTPELYIGHLVQVARAIRRVLRPDGTFWLNLGDSYTSGNLASRHYDNKLPQRHMESRQRTPAGLKPKDLIGIPWRAAFALQADGWTLRSDIVWAKGVSFAKTWHGNPMPESVTDRPTRAHEAVFLLTPGPRYFYDHMAIQEPAANRGVTKIRRCDKLSPSHMPYTAPHAGLHRINSAPDCPDARNVRDVWTITTKPFKGAHFAVFPPDLIAPMIAAGSSEKGVCPQCGAPWRRETAKGRKVDTKGGRRAMTEVRSQSGLSTQGRTGALATGVHYTHVTTGWRPGCVCPPQSPVPATILDPFGGAGTTALVAQRMGRNAVLIEPSAEYLVLAQERVGREAWILAQQEMTL